MRESSRGSSAPLSVRPCSLLSSRLLSPSRSVSVRALSLLAFSCAELVSGLLFDDTIAFAAGCGELLVLAEYAERAAPAAGGTAAVTAAGVTAAAAAKAGPGPGSCRMGLGLRADSA